jgi:hypothetical protein
MFQSCQSIVQLVGMVDTLTLTSCPTRIGGMDDGLVALYLESPATFVETGSGLAFTSYR